jgi:hypothetical protein
MPVNSHDIETLPLEVLFPGIISTGVFLEGGANTLHCKRRIEGSEMAFRRVYLVFEFDTPLSAPCELHVCRRIGSTRKDRKPCHRQRLGDFIIRRIFDHFDRFQDQLHEFHQCSGLLSCQRPRQSPEYTVNVLPWGRLLTWDPARPIAPMPSGLNETGVARRPRPTAWAPGPGARRAPLVSWRPAYRTGSGKARRNCVPHGDEQGVERPVLPLMNVGPPPARHVQAQRTTPPT